MFIMLKILIITINMLFGFWMAVYVPKLKQYTCLVKKKNWFW